MGEKWFSQGSKILCTVYSVLAAVAAQLEQRNPRGLMDIEGAVELILRLKLKNSLQQPIESAGIKLEDSINKINAANVEHPMIYGEHVKLFIHAAQISDFQTARQCAGLGMVCSVIHRYSSRYHTMTTYDEDPTGILCFDTKW